MKVLICKFFSEKDIERKIVGLVNREKKRASNIRVFCSSEQVQKSLELVEIESEVLHDFYRIAGPDDEPGWEKVYGLSDQLHASAEDDNRLKYKGINFLSLEYSPHRYLYAAKLSGLCRRMAEQGCDVLVLVLTEPLSVWLPDIKSGRIRTVKYANPVQTLQRTRLIRDALPRVRSQLRRLRGRRRSSTSTATKPDEAQPALKALFVVGPPLYARPAAALVDECLRSNLMSYVATDDRASAVIFQSQAIGYSMMPVLKASYPVKALPLFYRLRRLLRNRLSAESDDFSEAYLCTKALLADLFPLCYLAISSIEFMERMMKATSPDILCLMPDGFFLQQTASALGKKYNIPTLAASAAIETGNSPAHMRHLHADKKAVMGEVIRNLYVESGVEPDRIVVTGAANFDVLFNRDREEDKQALLACNIDVKKRIIVFATQHIPFSETKGMLIGVINAVSKINDVQLIVKVHPREDITTYKALAEEYRGIGLHVVRDIDLYALVNNCELLITKYSTTALEAIILDKPVVAINLSGEPTPVPYAEEGAALGVYKHEDIEHAIQKALYDEQIREDLKAGRGKFVRRWAGQPDGKAAHRIVALMKEMIAARKGTSACQQSTR